MDKTIARRDANPFAVTKAVDFSDDEIAATWVDIGDGGFFKLINPRAPMPRFIVGGKGIGRTHIMRYYSSALQAQRYSRAVSSGIAEDGYLGIYFRASGLNAGRFQGKNIDDEVWASVFMYYFDLWLTQHTLKSVLQTSPPGCLTPGTENTLSAEICNLFDEIPKGDLVTHTVDSLLTVLQREQRTLDVAINNAALRRVLSVKVAATPGRLVFGVPAVIANTLTPFHDVQFLYLIDELENFTTTQQAYLNTLIREKTPPSSFVIGARLYGIRTRMTTTHEENKEGSEFESIYLDRMYLNDPPRYATFCREVIAQRLIEAGHNEFSRSEWAKRLDNSFLTYPSDRLGRGAVDFARDPSRHGDRPHIRSLAAKLAEFSPTGIMRSEIEALIDDLRVQEFPLIEKLNTFVFYQEWSRGADLRATARQIADEAKAYIAGETTSRFGARMKLFKSDLIAQMLVEYDRKQRYLGVNSFIRLSGGSPRLLLVVLKYVYRWAVFSGENPFTSHAQVSEDAQSAGINEASKWFFTDSPGVGESGRLAQDAIRRLGDFFRALRYTDKPVESSLASFSIDETKLTPKGRDILKACQEFGFLLPAPWGQRDRNTAGVTTKLQLHPMLCPQWDLPIVRRGVTPLTASEANALFDPANSSSLQELTAIRVRRMNAPFGRPFRAPQAALPNL